MRKFLIPDMERKSHVTRGEPFVRTLVKEGLVAKKARDIRCLDVRHLVSYADYFLICSAQSEQHVKAITRRLTALAEELETAPLSVEGTKFHRWVLLDFGDVIVHVFLGSLRGVYELERLWADAKEVELDIPQQPARFWEDDDSDLDDSDMEEAADPSPGPKK